MRFIYGCFFGSFIATALGTTICSAWFRPGVESYAEFKQVCQEKFQAEQERDHARRQLSESQWRLHLDTLRRSQRDPQNPAGVEAPAEDRIPMQTLPAVPVPANPKDAMNDDGNDRNDQSQQEEGEEEAMATPARSTALAKSPGATLALNSVSDLEQLALMLYKGGLTPPGIDNPNKVAAVILAGMEVGLAPTQALGSIMLTNGKLTIYGDGALALVRASGLLESIAESVTGEGSERHGTCEVKRKGEPAKTFTFSMAEAEKAGLIERAKGKGPWATYPDRMLIMRPRGFALRDVFPDVLRGLITYEEASDFSQGAEVVNTEVRVVSTTADAPPQQPPASTMTPTATVEQSVIHPHPQQSSPATLAATSAAGPITADQKEEFTKLHRLIMAGKALHDPAARKAAWEQVLAPYGVSSINQMDEATAARAIAEIGKNTDPFGHGHRDTQSGSQAA
jgi:hypothetical protein